MGNANNIIFIIWPREFWAKAQGLHASDLKVWWAYVSYLNREGVVPFLWGALSRVTGLSPSQIHRSQRRLEKVGLLEFKGMKMTKTGRKVRQYLPTCASLKNQEPENLKQKERLKMRVCEMRSQDTIRELHPVVTLLLNYVVEGCHGLLDFGLQEAKDNQEPEIKSFAQFLIDEWPKVKNQWQAKNLIRYLKGKGLIESRFRYGGKRGRKPSFYFLNLPFDD